jgi:DNA-binding transcriptional regulator GbsR (MarR family)
LPLDSTFNYEFKRSIEVTRGDLLDLKEELKDLPSDDRKSERIKIFLDEKAKLIEKTEKMLYELRGD